MKRRPSIAAVGLLAFCAGCSISFFTLPIWVIPLIEAARDGNRSDWLGFAGAIIGGLLTSIVAVGAIYFAASGIRQQVRVGILGREEDKIVRELPGLRAAESLVIRFLATFESRRVFYGFTEDLVAFGLALPDHAFDATIKEILPTTDDSTLIQVRQFLLAACAMGGAAQRAIESAQYYERTIADPEQWDPGALRERRGEIERLQRLAQEQGLRFRENVASIHICRTYLRGRITLFEGRLIDLRGEAEEFFSKR